MIGEWLQRVNMANLTVVAAAVVVEREVLARERFLLAAQSRCVVSGRELLLC